MSDSANALARSLQGFGQALGNYGETVIKLDAKAETDAAQTEIVQQMEQFKQDLLTDPDYGTPEVVNGTREGYLAKHDELLTSLRKRAESIKNSLARQQVQGWLEETGARQETAVTQMQYEAWGKATFAKEMTALRAFNDTTTLSPEERIQHTYDTLDGLRKYKVIDDAKATEILSTETQYIMRGYLVDRAKEAYQTGGLGAAIQAITDNHDSYVTPVGPLGASDTIKSQAKQDISEYHKIVQESENSRLQELWANSVDYVLGRGNPSKPVLTSKSIQESLGDSSMKEHWMDNLIQLDNWMRTGKGAKDLGNVKALYQTMTQIAYRIRDTMGTARAGSEAQITLPDGTERTFTLDPKGFEAIREEMAGLLINADMYNDFVKLSEIYNPREGKAFSAFSALDDALLAKSKEKGFPPNLYIEMQSSIEAWKKDHPTANAEQVEKARQLLINDKVVQINTAHVWDYTLKGRQSEEKIGDMIASGEAAYYMGSIGNGRYDAISPLYKDSFRQYTASLYREVRELPTGEDNLKIPENAIGHATANGEYWISTKDGETMMKLGLGGSSRSAGAVSVSYTARRYGQDKTMQRFRQIEMPNKEFKNEVYLEYIGWVEVGERTAEDGTMYWDVSPDRLKEMREKEAAAEEKRQEEAQKDIYNTYPMGL